jgi:hypothetical protein
MKKFYEYDSKSQLTIFHEIGALECKRQLLVFEINVGNSRNKEFQFLFSLSFERGVAVS